MSLQISKNLWYKAAAVALLLHISGFTGYFYQFITGSSGVGAYGVEFDLGQKGDMGLNLTSYIAIAAEEVPKPEPLVKPPPVPPKQKTDLTLVKPKKKPKKEKKKKKPIVKPNTAKVTAVAKKITTGESNKKTAGGSTGQKMTYYQKLSAKIYTKKYYPRMSRQRVETGRVVVAFTVYPQGNINNLRLVKSSGHRRLDNAALNTIKRAVPMPAFDLKMGGKAVPITLPIVFRLED